MPGVITFINNAVNSSHATIDERYVFDIAANFRYTIRPILTRIAPILVYCKYNYCNTIILYQLLVTTTNNQHVGVKSAVITLGVSEPC